MSGVELTADAVDLAVEEVDQRPEQVGLEARFSEAGDECVEDVGDGGREAVGLGQRSWVGVIGKGAVAVHLQLVEQVRGGGGGVDGSSLSRAAPIAAFVAIARPGGGTDRHPQAKPEGRSAAEDGGARLSCLARKGPIGPRGRKLRDGVAGRARLRPDRSNEGACVQ